MFLPPVLPLPTVPRPGSHDPHAVTQGGLALPVAPLPLSVVVGSVRLAIGKVRNMLNDAEWAALSGALSEQTPKNLLSEGVEPSGLLTYVTAEVSAVERHPVDLAGCRVVTCAVDAALQVTRVLVTDLQDRLYCAAHLEPGDNRSAPGPAYQQVPAMRAPPASSPVSTRRAYGPTAPCGLLLGVPQRLAPAFAPPVAAFGLPASSDPRRSLDGRGGGASANGQTRRSSAPEGTKKSTVHVQASMRKGAPGTEDGGLVIRQWRPRGATKKVRYPRASTEQLKAHLVDKDATVKPIRQALASLRAAKLSADRAGLAALRRALLGADKRVTRRRPADTALLPLLRHDDGTVKTVDEAYAGIHDKDWGVGHGHLLALLRRLKGVRKRGYTLRRPMPSGSRG